MCGPHEENIMRTPSIHAGENLFHGHSKDWITSFVSAALPYAVAALFVFAYHEQWFAF
jgi:hypothetical protein